ncbi:MAG: hypothetical protein Q7S66_03180 [bacterium]|nr:hypothetical protein [bacterium]
MPKKTDNKTLGVKLRFWTNDLPGRVGKDNRQIPCWSCGVVLMEANKTKGISSASEIFNYIDDIPRAIKEVMRKSKIAIVESVGYSERAKKRKNNK